MPFKISAISLYSMRVLKTTKQKDLQIKQQNILNSFTASVPDSKGACVTQGSTNQLNQLKGKLFIIYLGAIKLFFILYR